MLFRSDETEEEDEDADEDSEEDDIQYSVAEMTRDGHRLIFSTRRGRWARECFYRQ